MLQLKNITKVYGKKGDSVVHALKGISLSFRESEFVSILGQSGCGKTTLLNIIGGLDRYTDGDLIINGTSTHDFGDRQWDTYRNHSIGFVFQSYNLIPHQTILENVELTMTLGGLPKSERKKRAKEALSVVGLKEKLNKRPNQLSGGQMQRVSIARAIVGEPDIILADEPTGALDSETSKTIMKLLKEISKTRLVIMVTHNPQLAEEFSDRIISMLDGEVTSDTNPYDPSQEANEAMRSSVAALTKPIEPSYIVPQSQQAKREKALQDLKKPILPNGGAKPISDEEGPQISQGTTKGLNYKKKHSSMSILTALRLSAKNLLSKKSRTFITSFAASIGIIGIAIILSISSGMSDYIDDMMQDNISYNYLSMSTTYVEVESVIDSVMGELTGHTALKAYPSDTTGIYPYNPEDEKPKQLKQEFTEEFVNYLNDACKGLVVDVKYQYKVALHILTKKNEQYVSVSTSNWSEGLNNFNFLSDKYTVLSCAEGISNPIPSEANEVALVVDKYNRLSIGTLNGLGIPYSQDMSEIKYEDLLGKEYRVVFNDGWYTEKNGVFNNPSSSNYKKVYEDENGITVKIVSVLRAEKDASFTPFKNGIAYSPKLTELLFEKNKDSAAAKAQLESEEVSVLTGKKFSNLNTDTQNNALVTLGYRHSPETITVYPKDVKSKDKIVEAINKWNRTHDKAENIYCADMSQLISSTLGTVVEIITYVLIAFSIVSLIISSIMIAIIIYASVIERTKEIGVLRSIGARKKDISRVFIAEAGIIGTISGLIAIALAGVVNSFINKTIFNLVGISNIATLTPVIGVCMVLLSVVLLLLASVIPALIAARKQPAVALRTE